MNNPTKEELEEAFAFLERYPIKRDLRSLTENEYNREQARKFLSILTPNSSLAKRMQNIAEGKDE